MSNRIANISQDYIDHLEEATRKAKNRLDRKEKRYQAALNERTDTQNWQDQLQAYWERVQKTDDAWKKVNSDIFQLEKQANKVNDNIELTLRAVKLLVCNVREVCRVLSLLSDEYDALKTKIESEAKSDAHFKSGQIMEKFNALGAKSAIQATDLAVVKVLDLAKAFFILHHAIDSERKKYSERIDKTESPQAEENLSCTKAINIYEEVKVTCGEREVKEPGLEWHIGKLKHLLQEGMKPLERDKDCYPCDDREKFTPTFPLDKGENRYYDKTKEQYTEAAKKTGDVVKKLEEIEEQRRNAQSRYNAYQAALAAAKAAKVNKK
jgi:archaellum component FlaC